MEKDFNIFDGKNFSDLSKEIYDNSKLKKTQLDLLIQEVHGYIQGIEDIALVGPIIKELFDASIKNDDNLLKLATVIQRIMNKQAEIPITMANTTISVLNLLRQQFLHAILNIVFELQNWHPNSFL